MIWFLLFLTISLEVAGTTLLKLSNGFEKPILGVLALVFYGVCFYFLAIAMKHLPVGITYAIWSAFGIVCILAIGIFLGEKPDIPAIIGISLIIIGVCVINLFSNMTVH